ncbi:MAG TPA: glycosyltransferase family 39 protein [Puia sp.]|nr:glycosyltransferase family 39 protein [Puia sp.]
MALKANRLLFFLALIKFILPFLLQHPLYEPHRDEFLYLAEGNHMAWGYMEVPPLLSVFAWLTHLFGDGMFWMKCWPSLFGALTFYVSGRIIISLGAGSFALLMAFLSFVLTGFLRVHFLFQPNFLEIFFWTMIAYALIRYIQEGKNKWLYVFGLSVGLGMLSKYSVCFMVFSVLLGLLLTRERRIFRNKHLYFAGLLAFLVFLPNLLWQWIHHFPVLHHMKELQETQLQYISPLSFLGDQLIMIAPCTFVWLVGLWMVGFSGKFRTFRFIGWTYVIVIALLLIGRGKSYYSLGIYPCLLAFGSVQLEQFTASRFAWLRYAFVILPLALAYYIIPVALPILPPVPLAAFYQRTHMEKVGVLKWEDLKNHPLPQDFSDMLGWKEMAQKMAKAYETLDSAEKKQTMLFCDNYGLAGAVNYYGKKYGLPEAYSDNASFLYWMPGQSRIINLVLLTDDEKEMEHQFIKEFSSAVLIDSVTNPFARERGDLIIVLKGANERFNQMFREKIEKKKAELNEH